MLRKVLAVSAIVAVALGGAACGSDNNTGQPIPGASDNWKIEQVPYEGSTITCLVLKKGQGTGDWGGPSCDFVKFWRENG